MIELDWDEPFVRLLGMWKRFALRDLRPPCPELTKGTLRWDL